MTFFYDLNKRLAQLADKQDAKQISEDAKAVAPKSKLAQALNERDMGKHNNATTGFAALAKKAGKEYGSKAAGERVAGAVKAKMAKAGKLEEQGMEEAVRGLTVGDQGYQPPTTQAQRDATAQSIKQNRAVNRADTRVTGYGNRVEPQQGAASGRGYNTGTTVQRTQPSYGGQETPVDFKPSGADVNPKHIDRYGNLQIKPGQGKGVAGGPNMAEADMEESAFQAAIGKKKYGDAGMKALQKAGREHASDKTMSTIRNRYDKYDESQGMTDEGNAFTAALKATPKGGKFKVGGKEFTDTSSIEEGFKEMDAWMASREKEKGTGKFDKKERTLPGGMKATTYTRKHEDDEEDDKDAPEAKGGAPKKKGRPKGKDKGPERVTAKAWKHKGERKSKTKEDLDSDSVMMTRPTNCSSESIEHGEQGEYNDEAGMTKDSLHTIVRHAKELESALRDNENLPEWVQEKIGQIKGMMSSVTDYIISTHERDAEQHMGREGITMVPESANFSGSEIQQAYRLAMMLKAFIKDPDGIKAQADLIKLLRYKLMQSNDAGAGVDQLKEKSVSKAQRKFMGMAHAIQKGERIKGASPELKKVAKTMKPSDTHDFATTKEKGLPKKVKKTDEANDGNLANNAKPYDKVTQGDVVAGRLGKDEMGGKKKKEDKVDETTVSGSVATATTSGKSSAGGMQFGKGVYEGFNNSVEQMITESISIKSKMEECGEGMEPGITITADGEEAAKLMMLLKLAGLENQIPKACPTCGSSPCGCAEVVDENSPDWPTDQETLAADPNLRTYSGGLNGPKSTGQSTTVGGGIPNVQLRRQVSMEENVELERSLFKTWKNYKG